MASQHQVKLETLFKRCDTNGTGYIDQQDFRDLCSGFQIGHEDADIIFFDLDHDQDGRISFEDFSFGFRDFLTPGSRRGSIQLGLASPTGDGPVHKKLSAAESLEGIVEETIVPGSNGAVAVEGDDDNHHEVFVDQRTLEKQRLMQKKHQQAQTAWRSFADHLGKDDVKKVLNVR